jgi:hypothetical protein
MPEPRAYVSEYRAFVGVCARSEFIKNFRGFVIADRFSSVRAKRSTQGNPVSCSSATSGRQCRLVFSRPCNRAILTV